MAKFCDKCGTQISDSAKFCPGCGAAAEAVPVQQAPPPPPQQYAAPPPPPPQQPYYGPPQAQVYAGAYAAQAPKKKFPIWLVIVISVVAAVCVLAIIGNTISDNTSGQDIAEETVVIATDTETEAVDEEPVAVEEFALPEPGSFTEYPVIVGEGTDYPLKGMITIPDNAEGKVPAVVLVHGSGDFDMDEEIYGNRPFRDYAEYLASYGIASIRYDKRIFTYWTQLLRVYGGGLTVKEEVIEDAIMAADLIKADPSIDENRVFIIGHSLGGYLAPRIHAEGGDFAGIISLAGSPRSRMDISADQMLARIMEMPEGPDKDAEIERQKTWARDMKAYLARVSDEEAKETPWGGFSVYYYKESESHPTAEYVKNIDIPYLILQGSADFLISVENDFEAWKDLLSGRDNAAFIAYEGFNHFFKPAGGYSITEIDDEFAVQGPPDRQVMEDIAKWVLTH